MSPINEAIFFKLRMCRKTYLFNQRGKFEKLSTKIASDMRENVENPSNFAAP